MHKRKKWSLVPKAFVVNVNKKEKLREAKKKILEEYGNKVETGDGSAVRFIPVVFGRKELDEKLYQNLQMHCLLKASKVEFKLDIQDVSAI